jgi:hypothetical protein
LPNTDREGKIKLFCFIQQNLGAVTAAVAVTVAVAARALFVWRRTATRKVIFFFQILLHFSIVECKYQVL